ncbi:MAG: response regulator transcription factor [Bacteroidota bacterium]|nr:response regulator transcription factor [Bacteroidota bacterium]
MKRQIKIAVVDDQHLFRKGIVSLLKEFNELHVVFEAEHGKDLLDKLKTEIPDVVLMDLEMPVLNGIETTKALKEKYPQIKIIILTMHNDEEFVADLLIKGAHGFLLKDQDIEIVADAIHAVIEKGHYFNASISEQLAKGLAKNIHTIPSFNKPTFTDRELEVMSLMCKQLTNKEIADRLLTSVRTIDRHRENLLLKMGVKNRAGIVLYAIQNNLVSKDFL